MVGEARQIANDGEVLLKTPSALSVHLPKNTWDLSCPPQPYSQQPCVGGLCKSPAKRQSAPEVSKHHGGSQAPSRQEGDGGDGKENRKIWYF